MGLEREAHLYNAPTHQNDAHGLNQAENEAGQVGNNGDGVFFAQEILTLIGVA